MRCFRPTYRRCNRQPNDPSAFANRPKASWPGPRCSKSAGKMSGHGIGRANGSAGSRIDAGGSWPPLNRSGPASRRPAQPALGVMGAVVVDWLSSNGRGNWARSKSGRLGRNSATAERGLFQLHSDIGARHARDLLHDAILDEEIMTLRHKVGVLFEFADDVGLAVVGVEDHHNLLSGLDKSLHLIESAGPFARSLNNSYFQWFKRSP